MNKHRLYRKKGDKSYDYSKKVDKPEPDKPKTDLNNEFDELIKKILSKPMKGGGLKILPK